MAENRRDKSRRLRTATVSTVFAAAACGVLALWLGATSPNAETRGADSSAGGALAAATHGASSLNLPKSFKGNLPITQLTEDEAVLHALDRLAYGPRPGEVERIKQMGLEKWINEQLKPASIDDSAMQERLANFPILRMRTAELLAQYQPPQMIAKREGISLDQVKQERKEEVQQKIAELRQSGQFSPAEAQMIRIQGTPQEIIAQLSMAKLMRAVYSPRQLDERMSDFWFNHFNVYASKGADLWFLPAYVREAIRPHAMGHFEDLLESTTKSPAMLFFLDNWMSVDPNGAERYQSELAARQQAMMTGGCGVLGPFANPIQLMRCQQRMARIRQRQQQRNAKGGQGKGFQRRGLNENYGRELMELHTIGVHYTQADVVSMAKVFTGWTIRQPRRDPQFVFQPQFHTPGAKSVLGYKIDAGGIKDGEEMLHKLAGDPRTAHFICKELAEHFVMDQPPDALVDRMAAEFLKTNGDIRQVMRTMIYSPEFWSRAAYRAKVKTPFELVASALRASGANVQIGLPLVQWVGRMGEPIYLCEPPTGYPDTSRNWVSTGALLDRMDFAIALATNHMPGTEVPLDQIFTPQAQRDPSLALNQAFDEILDNQVTSQTRQILEKRLADPEILQAKLDDPVRHINLGLVVGLVLGSPDFQKH